MCQISTLLDKTGTLSSLSKSIDKLLIAKPKALTLLVSAGNEFTKEKLDSLLTSLDIPLSGGIFHKIIFKDQLLDKGSIIIAWDRDVIITNYKNIQNTDSIKDLIGSSRQSKDARNIGEYLLFIDGAVSKIEENLDALYKKNGFRATFAGGGAGHKSMESNPCIISNEGLLANAMQTVATNYKSRITTTHGFTKKSGPHLVTSSDRTKINTLNYEPIVSFYKKHNKEHGREELIHSDFEEFYTHYPVGIENLDGELMVRDPINTSKNHIEYIGNIPEYSRVHILEGSTKSIREKVDSDLSSQKLNNEKNVDATFIFSCVNRDDSDDNHNSKEIKMLNKHLNHSANIVGALSLGEIATNESRLLQLHSKTIVISQMLSES
ncbi:MAG: FIST C-terminal domain-containing protein [Cocleimonas sp.]